MTKDEARRQAGAVWHTLSTDRRQAMLVRLQGRLHPGTFGRIFATFPVGFELDVLRVLRQTGLSLFLPVIDEWGMSFHLFAQESHEQPLLPGRFGIPAPPRGEEATPGEGDLCMIPSLACNGRGYRLGRGGGYFDRYFSQYPAAKKSLKVSLLPTELTEIHFPEQLHDLKLDEVLTDTGTVIHHAGE